MWDACDNVRDYGPMSVCVFFLETEKKAIDKSRLSNLLVLKKEESTLFLKMSMLLISICAFKGGTKPIFDIATSDFINPPKLYFTPKLAHFGLKMIIRHFSSKFWKTIDPHFCLLGNPQTPTKKSKFS